MKKLFIVFVVLGIAAFASMAIAATISDTFDVKASVAEKCTITGMPDVDFTAYDPTADTPLYANGTLSMKCVKATTFSTYVVRAAYMHGVGTSTEHLNYNFYTEGTWTTEYPTTSITGLAGTPPISNAEFQLTFYGRVPGGQNVGVDSYIDTATATVDY